MKAPVTVNVTTDNMQRCTVEFLGADGDRRAFDVMSKGNIYQGLHEAKPHIEEVVNTLLIDLTGAHASPAVVDDEPHSELTPHETDTAEKG